MYLKEFKKSFIYILFSYLYREKMFVDKVKYFGKYTFIKSKVIAPIFRMF